MGVPNVGDSLGPYVLEALAGQGGMGVVFRAKDGRLKRTVALKVLRSEDGHDGGATEQRFFREARIAASLTHPHICTIYEVGEHGGLPYLAMEWIEGRPLRTFLKDEATGDATRLELLALVAEAMAYAHESHVLHRDLKPANVMVDAHGRPKIVDFGLGKRTKPADAPHAMTFATADDAMLGTPSYMAPEQVLSPNVDARADQFSWGVTAYELLARVHPRMTTSGGSSPFPLGRPAPLRSLRPEVSREVASVVERAMQYDREDRFASMKDVAAALRAAMAGPGEVPATAARPPRAKPQRTASVFAAVVLGTVLVGGLGLALVARSSREVTPPPDGAPPPEDVRVTSSSPESDADVDAEAALPDAEATPPPPDAGVHRPAPPRRLKVSIASTYVDPVAVDRIGLAAVMAPCFQGVSLKPGRFVDGELRVTQAGLVTQAHGAAGCVNVKPGNCFDHDWVPKHVVDCVAPRFVGLRLPVRNAENSPEGWYLWFEVKQE